MKRVALVFALLFMVAGCDFRREFTAPPAGTIVDADTATVTGTLPEGAAAGGTVVVNGVTADWDGDTWSAEIDLDTGSYVTPVTAIYTAPDDHRYIQESSLIRGEKIDDGAFSPAGVGMLFTNGGLAGLGPVINSLAGGSFDISALILAQDPLIPPTDAGSGVTITGRAYEAGAEAVGLTTTSTAGGVKTPITVTNLYLGLDLQLSGLISGACKLEIEVPTTSIDAAFDLAPAGDKVDVNMVGEPAVSLTGVTYEFISGVCDPSTPLLGSIINSQAGAAIQGSIADGFDSQLRDPDGTGPADSPIADAIETALGNISIAGSVGEAVKANLDAPFTSITETGNAIDFRADADFHTTFGTGPSDCQPPAHAPDFTSSYHVPGTYPGLGATTPTGGAPYGLGLVISTSAFNQLLSSMTECGLLNQDLTEITLGEATLPVDSSVLSLLVPEFGTKLPPGTPLLIRIDPQAAPFLTAAPSGPGGTPAEMFLGDLRIQFVEPLAGGEKEWLSLSVDAPLGFDLDFDPAAGVLAPTITPPGGADVTTRVHVNELDADEAAVETVFSELFPNFVTSLGASFGAFPLPSFLGLDLEVVEIARHGDYHTLYSNLIPAQQTRLENVQVTDLSTADFNNDSALFDSWEWRHRIRKQVSPTQVKVNLDGMIGADACCTVDDERQSAHAGYRVALDVVPENGETWKLDLSHLIKGAHTANSEGVGGGYGAQSNISDVTGRYRLDGGAWQGFGFTVGSDGNPAETTPWQGGWCGCAFHEPFVGTNAATAQGDVARHVEVEYFFDVTAFSDSNFAFPAEAGNESAIRFGANDSLTHNFSVGDYPGPGNRNISQDGHFGTITLTTLP